MTGRHPALAVFGLAGLVAALVVAAAWVDVGDSTCGALYRPDIWLTGSRCTARMMTRGLGDGALAGMSLTLVAVGLAGTSRRVFAFPSLAIGVLVAASALWLVLAPISAYRELGPSGRRRPCGSAFRPLPGFENDEACFDAAQAHRRVGLVLLVLAVPALVGGGLLVRARQDDDDRPAALV